MRVTAAPATPHMRVAGGAPWKLPTPLFGFSRTFVVARWAEPFRTGALQGHKCWPAGRSLRAAASRPAARTLVIVESPTKATKVQGILGSEFRVVASYGHIRQLPSRTGAVDPTLDFKMHWELLPGRKRHLAELGKEALQAQRIFLATDPDREGEGIAWHLQTYLHDTHRCSAPIERVTFSEVTPSAVTAALRSPRQVCDALAAAYCVRTCVDFLLGYSLSPVIWRTLPGCRSAGRVQSVALRLLCEAEDRIDQFVPQEYFTCLVDMDLRGARPVSADVVEYRGRKVAAAVENRLSEAEASAVADGLPPGAAVRVKAVQHRESVQQPPAPFTTAKLQQACSNSLGFSVKRTMALAQKLFEGGFITYHRTDGMDISKQRLTDIRGAVAQRFPGCLPEQPRTFKTKAKNAQEAHEAIVVTDPSRLPAAAAAQLGNSADAARLYSLVWQQTLACQMGPARYATVAATWVSDDDTIVMRSSARRLLSPGFLEVVHTNKGLLRRASHSNAAQGPPAGGAHPVVWAATDAALGQTAAANGQDGEEARYAALAVLREGERVRVAGCVAGQHETAAPPRLSEAGLVKQMEELGIGRPSTYDSVITKLLDRGYAVKAGRSLVPVARGRVLVEFLKAFFPVWVDVGYTSQLEGSLDDVSAGRLGRLGCLQPFWARLHEDVGHMQNVDSGTVQTTLNAALAPLLFPPAPDGAPGDSACPACASGRLGLKISKHGCFLACSNYSGKPGGCSYRRPWAPAGLASGAAAVTDSADVYTDAGHVLGQHPERAGVEVVLRAGPYGFYIECNFGDRVERRPWPEKVPEDADPLAVALQQLQVAHLGAHPQTGLPVELRSGRFGPYFWHDGVCAAQGKSDATLEAAVQRLDAKAQRSKGSPRGKPRKARVAAQKRELKARSTPERQTTAKSGASSPGKRARCDMWWIQKWRAETGGSFAEGRSAWAGLSADQKLEAKQAHKVANEVPGSGAEPARQLVAAQE